jgi:cell division initiation protein
MEWTSGDVPQKHFRTCWRGLDPQEVEIYLQQLAEEIQQLKVENAALRKEVQNYDKDLKEYKDREKAIRNVLLNAHKTVEQMKANAEKEARLIVSEAEVKAERILQEGQERLSQLRIEIDGLKRQRAQMEMRFRSTIEAFQHLLEMEKDQDDEHQ